MTARLQDKVALICGAGSIGPGWGNGKATAATFARAGAKVFCVDLNMDAAAETAAIITGEGFEATAHAADVSDEAAVADMVAACVAKYGRVDILHNNVGISLAGGDAEITEITVEAFDHCVAVNLRGMVLTCKHALPSMRERGSGSIVNISSLAAWSAYPLVAYKTTKAAVVALTEQLAILNARYGIRANVILPGLMDTPMAVDTRVKVLQKSREEIVAARDAQVPLGRKMGTGWDIANAALFLCSDEASFITGAALPVDGGSSVSLGT